MIVVDSGVWIDFLNGRNAHHAWRLRAALGTEAVIVADLMLCLSPRLRLHEEEALCGLGPDP